MRKLFFSVAAVLFLAAGCDTQSVVPISPNPAPPGMVACPEDAKLCPDGSAVGRTGPQCTFAPCPTSPTTAVSGIEGVVTIGPSCPVLRDPPEVGCADKPYAAELVIKSQDGSREVARTSSGTDGAFKVALPPGRYVLAPVGGKVYPQASTQEVLVEKNAFTQVHVQFDSGIR